MQRTYWNSNTLDKDDYDNPEEKITPSTEALGSLVSSRLPNGNHAPALDIDLPCYVVASRTPGHFHLYIDKEMSWRDYKKLLKALYKAEIIENGYYHAAVRRQQTMLRKPTVGIPF